MIVALRTTTKSKKDKKLFEISEEKFKESLQNNFSGGEFMKEKDDPEDTSGDDSPNYRNKYKELKNLVKNNLSIDTQNAIESEDEKMEEIIEQLRKKGLSKEKGSEMQKLRSVNRGPRGIIK